MDNNILNSPVAELSRHQRKCAVCRHPDREAVEQALLHWRSPNQIASEYELEEPFIYRHAHATGLFARRRPNIPCALENLIERVEEIQNVKPETLVRAIQAYARMKETGEWVEPPGKSPSFTSRPLMFRPASPSPTSCTSSRPSRTR